MSESRNTEPNAVEHTDGTKGVDQHRQHAVSTKNHPGDYPLRAKSILPQTVFQQPASQGYATPSVMIVSAPYFMKMPNNDHVLTLDWNETWSPM